MRTTVIDDMAEAAQYGSADAAQPVRRLGWPFMAIYGMAYSGLWMALLPPVLVGLTMRARAIDPAHATGSLSLVASVGALLALFANPFFGHLSDRTTSRFGMRRPWLIAGALGGGAGLALVALATSVSQLLLGWCITQLAYNAELAALAAILADQVPASQRGTVSGVIGISLPLGMVSGTFLVEALAHSTLAVFLVPALIALASALLLARALPDHRRVAAQRPIQGWHAWCGNFWINPRRFPDFAWAWGNRFLVYAGVALLMTYQEFYLIHQLGSASADVPRQIFLSTLAQSCAVAAFSALGGGWSDAAGRRKVFVAGATLVYALALLVIAFATSYERFLAAMAIAGMAQGMYLAADLALVTDLLPERERHAARNLGIFNIANVLPQSLMPAVAPAILAASGGSYATLFVVASILVALGALAILPVREAR